MSNYQLGKASLDKLAQVHPDLARVIKRTILLTLQDFTVVEGLRSLEKQKENVANGKSQTMNSRHLTGHAVDLAPWDNGGIDWNTMNKFIAIAEAVRLAAIQEKVEVLWGASWSLALNYHPSAKAAFDAYLAECKTKSKKPFIDSPHFQLTWRSYP